MNSNNAHFSAGNSQRYSKTKRPGRIRQHATCIT